ncbi:alcohol dehydrogenase catalytic domain-containing protein [Nostoc sp.]|uniref:alcohol dehydrogenase catalytic domain-containing protein n=1 Tax=Nostoc sp. TaxID=1180 RepID=UPI002FF61E12
MVITNFGSPEVFVESEVDKPTPRNNEVLVKVYATSVNPADCGVRQGVFGLKVKLPAILGFDVSGVVEAMGENARDFQVGDEVYYVILDKEGGGANAEYHVVNELTLVSKTFSLHQVAQAHKTFEQGGEGVRGKIVVQVV